MYIHALSHLYSTTFPTHGCCNSTLNGWSSPAAVHISINNTHTLRTQYCVCRAGRWADAAPVRLLPLQPCHNHARHIDNSMFLVNTVFTFNWNHLKSTRSLNLIYCRGQRTYIIEQYRTVPHVLIPFYLLIFLDIFILSKILQKKVSQNNDICYESTWRILNI